MFIAIGSRDRGIGDSEENVCFRVFSSHPKPNDPSHCHHECESVDCRQDNDEREDWNTIVRFAAFSLFYRSSLSASFAFVFFTTLAEEISENVNASSAVLTNGSIDGSILTFCRRQQRAVGSFVPLGTNTEVTLILVNDLVA